jgi:aminoglycoside phosphotransferase (APT) family kinase protein
VTTPTTPYLDLPTYNAVVERSLPTAVRGYASHAVGCPPEHITAVTPFEDGNRHAVYKVSYLDARRAAKHVVVRVSYGGGSADYAQAEQEARVLKKVGGVAAPLLYDFSATSPWFETPAMCMGFVRGDQRELRSVSPADLERLGSVVGRVHGRPVDDVATGLTTANDIASYAEGRLQSIKSRLTWVRDPLSASIQARVTVAADFLVRSLEAWRDAESFRTAEPLALLHGDIGPGNILWGPDPVLIDWEYARLGDPADEIAYTFDQNGLAPPQREAFWRGYRESIRGQSQLAEVTDRVTWWEPVTLLGSALWWVERWVRRIDADAGGKIDPAVPREQSYYRDHVMRRLDRLDKLILTLSSSPTNGS